MVWVDPKNLGFRPYYERWVRTRYGNSLVVDEANQSKADLAFKLFDKVRFFR
jgi:dynein heavy chain